MNRRLILGLICGILIFIAVNLIAAHLSSDCGLPAVFGVAFCSDDIVRIGWPLRFYEEGGFIYRSNFNSPFLYIDMAIGLGFAVITGWVFNRHKNIPPK